MDTRQPVAAHQLSIENETPLAQLIAEELTQPVPLEALTLAADIRRRRGTAVAAILFYGSCLRTQNIEDGVLDFYVLVDSYRAVYSSVSLKWMNALLPPNVFYLEVKDNHKTIRAKYAVISNTDFARAATLRSVPAIIWARFSQPTRLAYVRDDQARMCVVRALFESTITMVTRALSWLPLRGNMFCFHPEALWQCGLAETYTTEFRAETSETIRKLYQAAPERYDRVALEALRELGQRGMLQVCANPYELCVVMSARQRRFLWFGWKVRKPLAKMLYALRLLKSAATFTNWLPYVLWKLERHTGIHIEPTEQQQKHPFLLGGPLIVKLLLQRNFR